MKVYFHLGIHKTASSFLQKEVFSQIKGTIVYLPRAELKEFKKYILYTCDFEFQPDKALGIFHRIVNPQSSAVIISDEEFYANPYISIMDRKRNFDRIKLVFKSDLYCIIFLREQRALIRSLYNQYVKTGGSAKFRDFIYYQKHPVNFSLSYLKYDFYIEYISNSIGPEKLQIILFEEFGKNKMDVLKEIMSFIGSTQTFSDKPQKISRNKSVPEKNLSTFRFWNKIIKSPKQPFLFFSFRTHQILKKILHRDIGLINCSKDGIRLPNEYLEEIQMSNSRLLSIKPGLKLLENSYLLKEK